MTFASPPYAKTALQRRAARIRAEQWATFRYYAAQTAIIAGVLVCVVMIGAGVVGTLAETRAEPVNAPISFSCGAYDVTYQAHDVASRDDVYHAAARQGCTLVANPAFRAAR